MKIELQDRVVVVTGGAQGIGAATARAFAEAGANVAIWDLNVEAGEALAVALQQERGVAASVQRVDVSDPQAVTAAVQATVARHGAIDVLINNAGIVRDAQLVKVKNGELAGMMDEDAFDAVLRVNLKGVFNCTQAITPGMIARGRGRVVNASSVVGLYGNFGQTNYVATKAGVIGMTRVWARELGRYGITVNAVAPGFIATEMVSSIPARVLERMVKSTPVGRMGQPEDIARAYVFLASDQASFINGAVLSVDGGVVLGT